MRLYLYVLMISFTASRRPFQSTEVVLNCRCSVSVLRPFASLPSLRYEDLRMHETSCRVQHESMTCGPLTPGYRAFADRKASCSQYWEGIRVWNTPAPLLVLHTILCTLPSCCLSRTNHGYSNHLVGIRTTRSSMLRNVWAEPFN